MNWATYIVRGWSAVNALLVPYALLKWFVWGTRVPLWSVGSWLLSVFLSWLLWWTKSPNSSRYQWNARPIKNFRARILNIPFLNTFEKPVLSGDELSGVNPDFDWYLCVAPHDATPTLKLDDQHGRYRFPSEVREMVPFIFKHVVGTKKDQFNDAKAGLKASFIPHRYGSGYTLIRTDFFSTRCTNNSIDLTVIDTTGGNQTSKFDGLTDLATNNGVWRELDGTLANEIGVSTLMFARRSRKMILTVQAAGNHRNAGNDVPTGSGGVDWSDVKKSKCLDTKRLEDLVVHAAERELREECGFSGDTTIESKIIGFRRDMNRGGKPEFLLISIVDDDESTRTRTRRSEKQYVSGHHPITLPVLPNRDNRLNIDIGEVVACLKQELRGEGSTRSKADQLEYHYMLLLRLLTGTWSHDVLKTPTAAFDLTDVPDRPVPNPVTDFLERALNQ